MTTVLNGNGKAHNGVSNGISNGKSQCPFSKKPAVSASESVLLALLDCLQWIGYTFWCFLDSAYRIVAPYEWQSKKEIRGKTVLLTGAGGGIGREMAATLAREGCRMALWDMNEEALRDTQQLCKLAGIQTYSQKVDITDRNAVYEAAEKLRSEFGRVDILINNAGIINAVPFLQSDDEKMSKVVDVNTKSLFWMCKAFLPHMISDPNGGHIVNVASTGGIFGASLLVDYAASKFGAFGFSESLALQTHEQGHDHVKFTTICPYYVRTTMINDLKLTDDRFPFLDTEQVANRVLRAIRLEERVAILPSVMNSVYALRGLLPWRLNEALLIRRRV